MTIQSPPGNNSNHLLGNNNNRPSPRITFIAKEQYQDFPLLILALPKNNPLKLFPRW